MKEEWTDKLKTRLEHHEMTPPEGLWEGISKQMDLAEKPVRKSSFPLSKRWIATAAALLALAGFFGRLLIVIRSVCVRITLFSKTGSIKGSISAGVPHRADPYSTLCL